MSRHADGINRVVLTLLGLALLAAGALGLCLGAGVFESRGATEAVLPQTVSTFPDGRPWFWWAVVGALVLIAVLALLWLLAQLKTDRTSRLDRTTDARDGYTKLRASALTNAVEDEVVGIAGVTGASADVREHGGQHVYLRVGLNDSADLAAVRGRLEDEVVAHLREGVGDPRFPVTIELRPSPRKRQSRVV